MSIPVSNALLWSNNQLLLKLLLSESHTQIFSFSQYKESSSAPYILVFVDLEKDLADITQKIIAIYNTAENKNQKIAIIIIQPRLVDSEKVLYFSQLLDQVGGSLPRHRMVITKDLYDNTLSDLGGWLESYLAQSLKTGQIKVSSKGENLVYPLSIQDLLVGLQKSLFLSGTEGKTFWLIGDPINDLDLAYLVKKSLDDYETTFDIDATEANTFHANIESLGNQSRISLNWNPADDFFVILKKNLPSIIKNSETPSKRSFKNEVKASRVFPLKIFKNLKSLTQKINTPAENYQQLLVSFAEKVFLTLVFVYFLITVGFISFTAAALYNLETAVGNLRENTLQNSVNSLKKSAFFGKAGESSYNFVSPLFKIIAPRFNEKNHNLFIFLRYSQASAENLQQTYALAQKIYESLGGDAGDVNYQDLSLALKSNLSQVYENINQIKLLTKNGMLPKYLESRLISSSEFKNLSEVEDQVTQFLKSTELVPAVFGGENPKNIVILFQNSRELRSTGGAVEFLTAISLEKGKLISSTTYQGPQIDSLVPIKVTAPKIISAYTGSDDWKVRDLNYNPDFSATSENFSAILEKSLKFKPDVIIALNESILYDLLSEEKGILLKGQTITSDVFRSQFENSAQNTQYVELAESYISRIFKHEVPLVALGRVLASQSSDGQLLFWSKNADIEKAIADQNFSGVIYPHSCAPAIVVIGGCHSETTYLSESNFSAVPIGNGLKKKITHKISFLPNIVKHQYIVGYRFTKEFPNLNRDLNLALQLYTPAGSLMGDVFVNEKRIPQEQIEKQQDNSLDRYQIPISLKFNTDNTLTINFDTPFVGYTTLPFSYSLTEYRQPGLARDDGIVDLIVNLPFSTKASRITSPAVSLPGAYNHTYPARTSSFGIVFEAKSR